MTDFDLWERELSPPPPSVPAGYRVTPYGVAPFPGVPYVPGQRPAWAVIPGVPVPPRAVSPYAAPRLSWWRRLFARRPVSDRFWR